MNTKDNANFFIVAVKAWVKKSDKYLLARRGLNEIHMPGVWSLPGGKVENDGEIVDVLQKTLKKEIMEEVGLEITDEIDLVFDNTFTRSDGSPVVALTFLCHWKAGEAMPLEDTSEVKWFTLDELKNLEEVEDFLKREISRLSAHVKK